MKKYILKIAILIIVIFVPICLLFIGFCAPAQFDETYYGELGHMYNRLKSAKGKRIILVGNSALAFGVRADLMAQEFPEYEIVNFGLYGAIGTKAMLDLSRVNISEDDIVVILPERNEQAQSLYFSATETWMAMDGNFAMLAQLEQKNAEAMAGNYLTFLAQKYKYISTGEKPLASGVYTQASFNNSLGEEVGYMTYERKYNIMPGGYDANGIVDFSGGLSEEFVEYLNEYNRFIQSKSATAYYGFTPVNQLGLSDGTDETVFYEHLTMLAKHLDFGIIGNPADYIMDYEWFYDTNYHVNSAGMYIYTARLVEDLKAELKILTDNSIKLPEKPQIPMHDTVQGDDSDAAYFTYENYENGVCITGLTDAGKEKNSFVIPTSIEGKPVLCFAASVFAGNTKITEITVQENVNVFYDNSFNGCKRLTKLVLTHQSPYAIGVGTQLLNGAENCNVYVKSDVVDLFATHYNWGGYRNRLLGY